MGLRFYVYWGFTCRQSYDKHMVMQTDGDQLQNDA